MLQGQRLLGITESAAADVVVTATSTAGALWQTAAPGTRLRERYESRPEPAQAVVDVEPRLTRTPRSLLNGVGVTATASPAAGPAQRWTAPRRETQARHATMR
ncbi:hypothetical protein ACFY6U_07400 [Streptomyces sp. NPDC013157]|uniref:hypothetical protein n=1 Tax=Streptomyces sp. NPDC013157 TaxID=3364861 RepID=UPI0036A191A0